MNDLNDTIVCEQVELKYQSDCDFKIGGGLSKALVIAIPKHVTGVKIVDPLAFYFLALPVDVFIAWISGLKIECLSQLRTRKIVFFKQLP